MEKEKQLIKKEIQKVSDSIMGLFVTAKIQSNDDELIQMIRDFRTEMFKIEDKVDNLFK